MRVRFADMLFSLTEDGVDLQMPSHFMPQRILLVANFDRRRLHAAFYNVDSKLHAGLVRTGHHVIAFSDRDVSREASPLMLSSRFGGVRTMRRRLVQTASHYQPDLVLFGHVDLVDAATIRTIRELVPEAVFAQFNVDPVFNPHSMNHFCARACEVDISFITTGDLENLALPERRRGSVHFFPNPVDSSIEVGRVFEKARDQLQYDGQFLGTPNRKRDDQIADLVTRLPDGYRFRSSAEGFGSRRLRSIEFLEALAQAACLPNLAYDDTKPVPLLYSSDRIAQSLGQGVSVLTAASAGLPGIYEDGVMEFDDREHMVDLMTYLWRKDHVRQQLGERGWRIAHERTAGHRVAKYLVETAFGLQHSESYGWPVEPIA